MSSPKFCVKRRLNDEQQAKAVTLAMKANPDNLIADIPVDGKFMAVEVRKKWSNGKALRVSFMNGDSVQRFKCQREAKKWEQFANITFVFGQDNNAEIRVAFYDPTSSKFNDQGSWSYVGTDCGIASPDEQTLNLGWLDKDTSDEEWQRVVVHEFGHALGCDHEDQQPAEGIRWNKEAVYKYFEGPPNNWSKEEIDSNILDPTPADGIAHTAFDSTSIMAYQIPAEFTLDGKGVVGGSELSEQDKLFIADMYPFRTTPTKLVIGAPQTRQEINATHPRTTFSLPVLDTGTYRIWTSLLDAAVTLTNVQGMTVTTGRQQVTFTVDAGVYTVNITPAGDSTATSYRIRAAKVS